MDEQGNKHAAISAPCIWMLAAFIALAGAQRAAAHWPSDIAAGTVLGVFIGAALGRL